MTWSLSNTITYVNTSSNTTALDYLFDTFLPTVGWTTSTHPDTTATKRTASRSYTNQLTGNTLTNYHWFSYTNTSTMWAYEDENYTTVPGDLATSGNNANSMTYNDTFYNTLDWKFWTSSERTSASLVTRGKYVIWLDKGVTDVFAYEDPSWTGATNNGATHFYPHNYSKTSFMMANAPTLSPTISTTYYVMPNHEGPAYQPPSVDSVIKGFDYGYSSDYSAINGPVAYRITGNDIVMHVPAAGTTSNRGLSGAGVVVQVGADYYFRITGDMGNVSPMLYMGTTEPDFS